MSLPNKSIPSGLLIVVEGIDGAGKTTLANSLVHHFQRAGLEVVFSKEPTKGYWGEKLRATAFTERVSPVVENEWLLRDRQEHLAELIEPALQRGAVVILDRYYFSTAAYQGAGGGLDPAAIIEQNEAFAKKPDAMLLIDVPPETGLERIRSRGDKANTFERADTLSLAREIFLRFVPAAPHGRVIDGHLSAGEVFSIGLGTVLGALATRLIETHGLTVEAAEIVVDAMGSA